MKIAINNQQHLLTINKREISALASFLMERAARIRPERQWQEISLVIADDRLMSQLNTEFMDDPSATDVLSFCLPPMPEAPALFSGEVFVNAQRAIALSRTNKGIARELALYIAHGCDHLMDEDDSDATSRQRMRNRELRWLREADSIKLLDKLAKPLKDVGR